MSMNKAIHPRNGIDRLYVSGKEGTRKLPSLVDCVDTSIQGLEDEKKATKCSTDNMSTNTKTTKIRKEKWEEKTVWIFEETNWRDCMREGHMPHSNITREIESQPQKTMVTRPITLSKNRWYETEKQSVYSTSDCRVPLHCNCSQIYSDPDW